MKIMTAALALFLREWRIARRIGGGASVGAVFFLILVAIMPFALGPDLVRPTRAVLVETARDRTTIEFGTLALNEAIPDATMRGP